MPRRKVVNVGSNRVRGKRLSPESVTMPPPVTPGLNHHENDAQLALQAEVLMTKGIRAVSQLQALLGVSDRRRMDRIIRMVHARWEMYGSNTEMRRLRGEGLARLDLIENELWVTLSNTEDERIKQVALRNLLEVTRQRSELHGLSARRIEMLVTQIGNGEADERLTTHAKVLAVAKQLGDLIQARIEGPLQINGEVQDVT
jgi:hypothetical protein